MNKDNNQTLLNIFFCKDAEEFCARVTRFAFETFESEQHYNDCGDWIYCADEDALGDEIKRLILRQQDSIIMTVAVLIDMFKDLYERKEGGCGLGFVETFGLLCREKTVLVKLQDRYNNIGNNYTIAKVKKWLSQNIKGFDLEKSSKENVKKKVLK